MNHLLDLEPEVAAGSITTEVASYASQSCSPEISDTNEEDAQECPEGAQGGGGNGNSQSQFVPPLGEEESPNGRRVRGWVFTVNSTNAQNAHNLSIRLNNVEAKYVFQEEIGGRTHRRHIQGFVYFPNKRTFNGAKRILKVDGLCPHIKECASVPDAVEYCSKRETKIGRTYCKGYQLKSTGREDPMLSLVWRDWQLQLKRIVLAAPHDRLVHWRWSEQGGIGKSTFCLHLILTENAMCIGGRSLDIFHGVSTYRKENGDPRIVLIDIPRSCQELVNYAAIEQVKNGFFFSGKYDSCQVVMNIPHVLCFANFPPNLHMLSSDRWDIAKID